MMARVYAKSEAAKRIVRGVAHLTDPNDLRAVDRAVFRRQKSLGRQIQAKAYAKEWPIVAAFKPGDVVYSHTSRGLHGGLGIYRGDCFTVYAVQPRAKRLWLTRKDQGARANPFSISRPHNITGYRFRKEPPDDPCSPEERARRRAGRNLLADVFSVPAKGA